MVVKRYNPKDDRRTVYYVWYDDSEFNLKKIPDLKIIKVGKKLKRRTYARRPKETIHINSFDSYASIVFEKLKLYNHYISKNEMLNIMKYIIADI
jgi:hypothetical protein